MLVEPTQKAAPRLDLLLEPTDTTLDRDPTEASMTSSKVQ